MSYQSDRLQRKLGLAPALPTRKEKKHLNKVSPQKAAKDKKDREERGDDDSELVKWFKNRMKQMTGYCAETHLRTETKIYSHAIFSICHILEKRDTMFPSVKVHPQNWIELAPDIHTLFDKVTWEEREMMGCWNIVWERLLLVYPSIDPSELYHLPTELRERIEKTLKEVQ